MLSDRLVYPALSARISSLAVVGAPGEDKRLGVDPPNHGVVVDGGAVIREFCTVHGGFRAPTHIGPRCYLMAHSHVGHDCVLMEEVQLSSGAILGGHTIVHSHANIGLGAITHQFTTIGAYAMVGMGSVVTKDIPPFTVWVGNPARCIGVNVVGMERGGYTQEQIGDIKLGRRTPWHDLFDNDAGRRKR